MGQREGDSVSNTPPTALVRSVLCGGAPTSSAEMRKVGGVEGARLCVKYAPSCSCPAYSLQRREGKGAERERGSVSNTPPAALVRSVLCSGMPTPSAEV
jgi:hypothetical protein